MCLQTNRKHKALRVGILETLFLRAVKNKDGTMENPLYPSPVLMSGKATNQLFINLFIKKH